MRPPRVMVALGVSLPDRLVRKQGRPRAPGRPGAGDGDAERRGSNADAERDPGSPPFTLPQTAGRPDLRKVRNSWEFLVNPGKLATTFPSGSTIA